MSLEIIRQSMEEDIPLLNLLNMDYIDKSESFIAPDNNKYKNGRVYFKINLNKICSKKILDRIFKTAVNNYGLQSDNPSNDDEYFVVYDVLNKLGVGTKDRNKGGITSFAVRHKGKMFPYGTELIGGTLMYMDYFKYPESEKIQQNISEFASECIKWIKEQICNKLMQNIKGIYVADDIQCDTYFQRRKSEQKTYDYVIHNWGEKLMDNEIITWVNIFNENKIYIALD